MMIAMNVSVADAKNRLPELIKAVEKGQKITICRYGKPIVDLVPTATGKKKKLHLGGLSHLDIVRDPDWWKPMTKEEVEAFLQGRY